MIGSWRTPWRRLGLCSLGLLSVVSLPAVGFKAGVGRVDITPTEPVHLAGYGTRAEWFKSVEERIFVKALALQDDDGAVTLLVTADTLGNR